MWAILGSARSDSVPCTPHGVIKMLEYAILPIAGKRAVIIGRSNIVGKPMANLLLARNATVTVCHSRTADLPGVTREADLLVAAIGKPRFVHEDMVKPGATVIDVGINRVGDKLVGDVDFRGSERSGGSDHACSGRSWSADHRHVALQYSESREYAAQSYN